MSYRYYRRPSNAMKIDKKEQPFFSKTFDNSTQSKSNDHPFFQMKGLTIGKPGDKYEQEADAMADAVVNHTTSNSQLQKKEMNSVQRQSLFSKDKEASLQKQVEEEEPLQAQAQEEEEQVQAQAQEEEEKVQAQTQEEEEPLQAQAQEEEEQVQAQAQEEEEPLQAKSNDKNTGKASSDLKQNLANSKGQGHHLPKATGNEMGNAFGTDFSGVTIHTDSNAVQMNKALGAQAFTHGQDIYFNSGKYNPDVSNGKRLLAHELTHVVQQKGLTLKKRLVTKI